MNRTASRVSTWLIVGVLLHLACGGGGGGSSSPPPPPPTPSLSLSPTTSTLGYGGTATFSASGANFGSAHWSVLEPGGGTISGSGTQATYTAPFTAGTYHVVVKGDNPSLQASAEVKVIETLDYLSLVMTPHVMHVQLSGGTGPLPAFASSVAQAETVRGAAKPRGRKEVLPPPPSGDSPSANATAAADDPGVIWTLLEGPAAGVVHPDTGEYTPSQPGVYHLVATRKDDPKISGTIEVVVRAAPAPPITALSAFPGLAIFPDRSLMEPEGEAFLKVISGPVSYSLLEGSTGGSLTLTGGANQEVRYTAPAARGVYSALATLAADPTQKAQATLEVGNRVSISVAPSLPQSSPNATVIFTAAVGNTASTGLSWKVVEGPSGGTLSGRLGLNQFDGTYPGTWSGGQSSGPNLNGTLSLSITNGVLSGTISPISGSSTTLSGTVSGTGAISASIPATPGGCALSLRGQITTNTSGTTTASGIYTLIPSASCNFASGSWTATTTTPGNTVTYTAPSVPGKYHVRATSLSDPNRSGEALVEVTGTSAVSVQLLSPPTRVESGTQTLLLAAVFGSGNGACNWSTTAGSITNDGLWTAPLAPGPVTITATSAADGSKSASTQITVANLPRFTSLPATKVDISVPPPYVYSYTFSATHAGGLPMTFSLEQAPAGATLVGNTISWTPTSAQGALVNTFILKATDSVGGVARQQWTIDSMLAQMMAFVSSNIWAWSTGTTGGAVLIMPDGSYVQAQATPADFAGKPGVEAGRVTIPSFDANGFLHAPGAITVDTNLEWGLSHPLACDRWRPNGTQIEYGGCSGDPWTSLSKMPNDPTGIVGGWSIQAPLSQPLAAHLGLIFFFPNGTYLLVGTQADAPCQVPGVEFGSYTYDPVAHTIKGSNNLYDTSGCYGLHQPGRVPSFGLYPTNGFTLSPDGKTATVVETDGTPPYTAYRISK